MVSGNSFRQLRESKGQSLRDLSLQADLSVTVVGRFERDELLDCRPKTRLKLSRGYGVDIQVINNHLDQLHKPMAVAG